MPSTWCKAHFILSRERAVDQAMLLGQVETLYGLAYIDTYLGRIESVTTRRCLVRLFPVLLAGSPYRRISCPDGSADRRGRGRSMKTPDTEIGVLRSPQSGSDQWLEGSSR